MVTSSLRRLYALLFMLCTFPGSSFSSQGEEICTQLESLFQNRMVARGDADYEELRTRNWVQNAWATPWCIFVPDTTQQLQTVVPLLAQANTKFAIRSGGHSPHPRAANVDDGLLIDLSHLSGVEYDSVSGLATVGTGATWDDVYQHLYEKGVTVVGGRVGGVGVGGLTLGGGLSWHSNLHGMVADNVVNFEIVLADGSLVNANATSHTDLFKALKGGGNNFGIVIGFTLLTYPIGQVWGGVKLFPVEDLPDLLRAVYEYQSVLDQDPYSNFILVASPTNDTVGAVLFEVYLKPEAEPESLSPFATLTPIVDQTGIWDWPDLIAQYPVPDIPRMDWSTTTFQPDESLYEDVAKIVLESPDIRQIGQLTGGFVSCGFQPVSRAAVEAGKARGGNVLGLHVGPQIWFAINAVHWWSEDDVTVHDASKRFLAEVEESSSTKGRHLPYRFMNDATWDQEVIHSYGSHNGWLLRHVQKRYDPTQVFQRLVPGYFKL